MNAPALGPCPHCGQEHPEGVLVCPEKHEQMPLPGRLLAGKFRFERLLGEGGMGSVWQASNVLVRKAVAIKLIRPEFASNPAILARFRNEATAAGQIGSPHICDILDFGQADLGPYIVMELMRGQALNDLIEKSGRVDPSLAVIIVRQALEGLDAAHRVGIIHRDLKPENIFLSEPAPGRLLVKLMDFGISKFTQAASEGGRTGVGVLMGTPEYMSPEQSQGAANVDERTDIWAMGLILYKALTGVDAFAAPTVAATLVAVATRDPPPLHELAPHVHPGLAEIIRRCTAKEPATRYASARELSDALAPYEAIAGAPGAPAPVMAAPGPPAPGPLTAAPTPGPMTTPPLAPPPPGFTSAPSFTAAPRQAGTFLSELGAAPAQDESWSLGRVEIRDERPTPKDDGGGLGKVVMIVVLVIAGLGAAIGGYFAFRGGPEAGTTGPEAGPATGDGKASAGGAVVADAGGSGGASSAEASVGEASAGAGGASAGEVASAGEAASAGASAGEASASAGEASAGEASGGGEAPPKTDEPKTPPKTTPKTTKTPKKPAPKDVVAVGDLYTPKEPGEAMPRSVAREHCQKLEHGGRDDWELATVAQAEKFKMKVGKKVLYWTTELAKGRRDHGMAIDLRTGNVSERPISEAARPLCVTKK